MHRRTLNPPHNSGFTLVEILVTVGIIVTVVLGLSQLFIQCSALAEMSRDMTFAVSKAQSKMEEIRNYQYDSIVADYGSGGSVGNTFQLTRAADGVEGMGVIYIDSSNASLLKVRVAVSWRTKEGRVIGEDNGAGTSSNALNGVLNTGEDANGNGQLDSMTQLENWIAMR